MASPRPNQTSATMQPLTPPADPPSANHVSASKVNAATSNAVNTSAINPLSIPATSLNDAGKLRRPRDARLIHMLLASQGVTAYQERVPLQLLDFAYRYTSSTLQDAVHLATEGYAGNPTGPGEANVSMGGGRGAIELNTVTLQALRLSIASRLHYQFQPSLPKEFLMDVASDRNRIALPGVARGFDTSAGTANRAQNTFSNISMGGMRLPPERFCLTGVGWNLKQEWESEGEEDIEDVGPTMQPGAGVGAGDNEEEDPDDEGDGKMEDIFGPEDTAMGEGDEDGDEDKTMTDA